MDNRPIIVRTTISAQDFWYRERDVAEVDQTNGRVLPTRNDTPYGRQVIMMPTRSTSPPALPPPRRVTPAGADVGGSREVERAVLRTALTEVDTNIVSLRSRNHKLETENAILKEQLQAAFNINCALARMITDSDP